MLDNHAGADSVMQTIRSIYIWILRSQCPVRCAKTINQHQLAIRLPSPPAANRVGSGAGCVTFGADGGKAR